MRKIVMNPGEGDRKCRACGEYVPIYRFGNGGKNPVCITCESSRSRGIEQEYAKEKFAPPLTPEMKKILDEYVQRVFDGGGYASLNANHRLLRHMSRESAHDLLFVYADLAREWCSVKHSHTGCRYHFTPYEDGEQPGGYRSIDPRDFATIDNYIAMRPRPVLVDVRLIERATAEGLRTSGFRRWILIRTYLGLHPEHKILWRGAIDKRSASDRRYDTYLVGDEADVVPGADVSQIARKMYRQETGLA